MNEITIEELVELAKHNVKSGKIIVIRFMSDVNMGEFAYPIAVDFCSCKQFIEKYENDTGELWQIQLAPHYQIETTLSDPMTSWKQNVSITPFEEGFDVFYRHKEKILHLIKNDSKYQDYVKEIKDIKRERKESDIRIKNILKSMKTNQTK